MRSLVPGLNGGDAGTLHDNGLFQYLTGKPFGFGFIGGQGSNGTPPGTGGAAGKNDEGENDWTPGFAGRGNLLKKHRPETDRPRLVARSEKIRVDRFSFR